MIEGEKSPTSNSLPQAGEDLNTKTSIKEEVVVLTHQADTPEISMQMEVVSLNPRGDEVHQKKKIVAMVESFIGDEIDDKSEDMVEEEVSVEDIGSSPLGKATLSDFIVNKVPQQSLC